jgi:hypothetical protein
MSLGADILLKIRSTFESKPLEEAKKKTEDMGKTADKAGKDAASGMNVMAAATALMQGNVNGAIGAIAPLIEKLKVLKLSLTQLTLVGALVGTLVAAFKSFRDAADAAAQRMAGIKMDNLRNEITSTAEAYDKLKASQEAATAKGDALLEHNQAMIEANKRLSLSINEISKQRELSTAKTDEERRVIENRYKSNAENISGSSEQDKENAALQRSMQRESEIEDHIKAAEARKQEAIDQAAQALKQSQKQSNVARSKIGFMSMVGGTTGYDTWSGMAKQSGSSTDAAIKEAGEADSDIQKLRDEKEALRRKRELDTKNRDAANRERTASKMATSNEATAIQSDIAAKEEEARRRSKKDSLQSEYDAKNQQYSSAAERFGVEQTAKERNADIQSREYKDSLKVSDSYRKKGDRKGQNAADQAALQEKAEAEAAAKAVAEVIQRSANTLSNFKAQMEAIKEQMKRLD